MNIVLLISLLAASLVLSLAQYVNNDDDNEYQNAASGVYYSPVIYHELTCEQYASAYNAIDGFISDPKFSAFAIQGIVRLSFHDCVGTSCDGCLNPNDSLNGGLSFRTNLDTIYDESFRDILSRADFYALAGHVALIRGVYNTKCSDQYCPSLFLDYKWGRKDCATSPNTTSIDGLPNAHGDLGEVLRVLSGMLGLNLVEVVALMGGHSLGGSHTKFSGFNFTWQVAQTVFDNSYFINMIADGFIHKNVGNRTKSSQRFEFVRPLEEGEPLLMLNVDMALWKQVIAVCDHGQYTGHLGCTTQNGYTYLQEGAYDFVSQCDEAVTAKTILAYANNVQLFYDDFTVAWAKMVSHGYPWYGEYALQSPGHNGQVCGSCVPQGAYCATGYSKSGACCGGFTCQYNVCS